MKIRCLNCNKEIEKKGQRLLCIHCANLRDKEIAKKYRETHRDEIRGKNRERAKEKRDRLKWEE